MPPFTLDRDTLVFQTFSASMSLVRSLIDRFLIRHVDTFDASLCVYVCRRPFNAHNQLALAMKINTGKVAPIPSRYSPGLFATIEWMLNKTVSFSILFFSCCFASVVFLSPP